jgi:Protein of unknown function (DUF2637)
VTTEDTMPAAGEEVAARRRAAARAAYRASLADGVPLTGAELGRRFGLSPRWGRLRVAEVQAGAATGNGGHQASDAPDNGLDRDRARSGPKPDGGDGDVEGRAEAASGRTLGANPHADLRTASERWRSDEAPTQVTPMMRGITTLAVLAVAFVAATASYDHQRALAELAGEGWRAWFLPVSVDGLVLAASMSMLARRRAGLPAGVLAWVSLIAGIGASLAANVAAADPTIVGRVVAAWPPVALLLAWELLMQVRAPATARHASR